MLQMKTERMEVVAATLEHLDAELEGGERFARLLGAVIPAGWPPGEYDRAAIAFLRARLQENPGALGWLGWYALLREDPGGARVAAGAGGYFGPPDASGQVEVGYSIVAEYQRRGLATELLRALLERAFGFPSVRSVRAHTHPANIPSIRVLERCGFRFDGQGAEAGTVRYLLERRTVPPLD